MVKHSYGTDEEEPNEMVVVIIDWRAVLDWRADAINAFLYKWENAIFATPPPFKKPNNIQEFQRRMLEHLAANITGASVTSDCSIDCDALASILLTAAICRLDRQQWVRTILDAQPAGWDHVIGAILVPHDGRTELVTLGNNRMFKLSCKLRLVCCHQLSSTRQPSFSV